MRGVAAAQPYPEFVASLLDEWTQYHRCTAECLFAVATGIPLGPWPRDGLPHTPCSDWSPRSGDFSVCGPLAMSLAGPGAPGSLPGLRSAPNGLPLGATTSPIRPKTSTPAKSSDNPIAQIRRRAVQGQAWWERPESPKWGQRNVAPPVGLSCPFRWPPRRPGEVPTGAGTHRACHWSAKQRTRPETRRSETSRLVYLAFSTEFDMLSPHDGSWLACRGAACGPACRASFPGSGHCAR